ncbi:DUF4405 domain-containing protein [Papillibacter cinnamivorans]|uniref:Flavinylation-associated cytochrome domain-containing protein n=1 Tax=Papillibacter cinnamivorans DSM 12816 TaxID=1122930 RepID=A0A1W2BWF7_9FIRM|nr:DUF4405 domain-containing protein [Papillibacter cinnamivorans]SMC77335.1 protein of unknown function [Papillibacter cinnamivorans DSM 12816]
MNRKWIKLVLDIVMAVSFVLLMNLSFTGLLIHESLGLGILAFFALHLWLNGNWIKGVFAGLGRGRIAKPAKLRFVLDLALLILLALIVVSGLEMSRVLFPSLGSGSHEVWYTLHVWASFASAALLALHLGLHWRFLWNGLRGAVRNRSVRRWGAGALTAFILLVSIRSVFFKSDDSGNTAAVLSSGTSVTGNSDASASQQDETITDSGTSGKDDENSLVAATPAPTQAVSLEDYLSKLVCTGCGRHCSLLSPGCAKGELQAAQAEQTYNEKYATE